MSEPEPPAKPAAQRIGAILLAAGGSARMGQPKQLLTIQGEPQVSRSAQALLEAGCWPVAVVLGHGADSIQAVLAKWPLQIARNNAWERGMGTSLRVGLQALKSFSAELDAILVTVADQPLVAATHLARLLGEFNRPEQIVAARYAGTVGAPVVFGRVYFPGLGALADTEGAQRIVKANMSHVTAVDLPEAAVDLDTPADYEAFRPSVRALL